VDRHVPRERDRRPGEADVEVAERDGAGGNVRTQWFERLWADEHARMYNLAARIVGDRDEAADVTQEVFLRAYTHAPDLEGSDDPGPWLYRVTVNACYDHLRRRNVRPTAPLEAAGEVAAARDGFATAEMTRAVETALTGLTPRYRTALVLKDLHGLETVEIAEAMEVSRATARVLLHRSRAAFKKAFRDVAPAGAGLPVAGLALLPTLPVPPSLHAPIPALPVLPAPGALSAAPSPAAPTPATMTPSGAAPVSASPSAVAPAAIGPASAASIVAPATGVLAKVGSALGLKVAAVTGAVVIAAGGTAAVTTLSPSNGVRSTGEIPVRAAAPRGAGDDQGRSFTPLGFRLGGGESRRAAAAVDAGVGLGWRAGSVGRAGSGQGAAGVSGGSASGSGQGGPAPSGATAGTPGAGQGGNADRGGETGTSGQGYGAGSGGQGMSVGQGDGTGPSGAAQAGGASGSPSGASDANTPAPGGEAGTGGGPASGAGDTSAASGQSDGSAQAEADTGNGGG
jgi:RNA polymerase sigma-70 factor, ECF subfamily